MAKLGTTNIGGGGGIGSDELTATADKVVVGNTYVGADTDDEIGIGMLVDRGSSTPSNGVSISESNLVTKISNGAYRTNASSGYPEITTALSSVTASGGLNASKLLSGQNAFGILGTATNDASVTSAQMLAGASGYSNGIKVNGAIASLGVQTINPSASQQTVYSSGKYMTGNVVVNGVSNLTAANVRENVNVGGTVGTMVDYSYLAQGRVVF